MNGESWFFLVWHSHFSSSKCGRRKDGCHGIQHPSAPAAELATFLEGWHMEGFLLLLDIEDTVWQT